MFTGSVLQNVWYLLIGVLFAGYSVLDGFDLGVGVLFPFLAKNEEEKRTLIAAIGPVWDGNEVWLLAAGGALFAAFPLAYATVFSGFYLALMLVLFSLILRAVSLEFRAHDPARRGLWEAIFVGSSFLPALLFGVALGNVVGGVPLDARTEYAGSFFTLLRPLPLAFGVIGLCVFLLHGSAYAALKTTGALRERARKAAKPLAAGVFIALFLAFIFVWINIPKAFDRVPSWIIGDVVCLFCALFLIALKKGKDGRAFVFSSAIFLGLWGIVGAIHYPNLVRATDPALSLTLANASSSPLTLKVMLIIALVGMPIVVGYTIFAYRVFKGKVEPGGEGY
jgi:cytochrome d ubiquinol oxidase subunit II